MKSSSSPARLILWLSVACCVMWTIHAQTEDTPTVTVTIEEDMATDVAGAEEGAEEGTTQPDESDQTATAEDVTGGDGETEVTEEPKSSGCISVVSATLLTVAVLTTKLV